MFTRETDFDILGYVYRADIWCPECVHFAFEGDPRVCTEEVLDRAARERGIDREDETSFDSDEFPKVIMRFEMEPGETCGECALR